MLEASNYGVVKFLDIWLIKKTVIAFCNSEISKLLAIPIDLIPYVAFKERGRYELIAMHYDQTK